MPKTSFDQLRDSIHTTLALRAGSPCDSHATADAATATWRRIELELTPVIGARGLAVLFNRALQQTSAVFPWLTGGAGREASADPLPRLAACLASQPVTAAAPASAALLLAFVELLTSLIGESLTARLLAPVWAAPSLPAHREPAA